MAHQMAHWARFFMFSVFCCLLLSKLGSGQGLAPGRLSASGRGARALLNTYPQDTSKKAAPLRSLMQTNTGCKKSVDWKVDEAKNRMGPNRCSSGCECDGLRTCSSSGFCQGTSRPPAPPATNTCKKSVDWRVDEAKNKRGPNRCTSSCECDGLRTCSSFGFCQGTSRPPATNTCRKSVDWSVDEAKNKNGPNKCSSGCECDGLRTCSQFGFCQGTSRP